MDLSAGRSRFAVVAVAASVLFGAGGRSLGSEPGWIRLHDEAEEKTWAVLSEDDRRLDQPPDRLYVAALRALTAHADDEAALRFAAILAATPDDARARWGLAELARRRHEPERAMAESAAVLKDAPAFAPAELTIAYTRITQGRFVEAMEAAAIVTARGRDAADAANYCRALVIQAGARGLLAHHGGLVSKLRHGTRVRGLLREAEQIRPNGPEVLIGLGSFFLFSPRVAGGDLDRAVDVLERATVADPLLPDAWVRLGQAWRQKGREDRYAECLARAQAIDPRNELVIDIASGTCLFICVQAPEGGGPDGKKETQP